MGTSSAASREMPKSFSVPCDGDFMVMVIFQVDSKDGDLPMKDGDFPVRYISLLEAILLFHSGYVIAISYCLPSEVNHNSY